MTLRGIQQEWLTADYIRVNAQILINPEFTEDMINNTIPHEVAHVVVRQTWPSAKGHGKEWKLMMYYLGLEAERCHSYDTVAARQRQKAPRPHVYYCNCDEPHRVTNILHRRMQQGRRYTCRKCGSYLTAE
jgi:SprT protein